MKTLLTSFSFVLLLFTKMAYSQNLPGPLVNAGWLKNNLDKVHIVDVRKDIKSFNASPVFKTDKKTNKKKLVRVGGHIPGAALVNYKYVRSKQKMNGNELDSMLPAKKDFEKLMQQAGVEQNDTVIIVSKGQNDGDMTIATRFYWQMKYYGHTSMAILDGGVAAWILAGQQVTNTASKIAQGNWTSKTINASVLATSEDVANAVKNKNQLVDARSISQYLGVTKKSYVYAKGHIPGAKLYPTELVTRTSIPATFLPQDELKTLNKAMGIDTSATTITYCNSGHLASGNWFMMSEILGNKNVKMYDGSMHQWTKEKRPVSTGVME